MHKNIRSYRFAFSKIEPASDEGELLERVVHLTDLWRCIAGRLHPADHRPIQNDAITRALRILGGHIDIVAGTEARTCNNEVAHFASSAHHRDGLYRADRLADGVEYGEADDTAGAPQLKRWGWCRGGRHGRYRTRNGLNRRRLIRGIVVRGRTSGDSDTPEKRKHCFLDHGFPHLGFGGLSTARLAGEGNTHCHDMHRLITIIEHERIAVSSANRIGCSRGLLDGGEHGDVASASQYCGGFVTTFLSIWQEATSQYDKRSTRMAQSKSQDRRQATEDDPPVDAGHREKHKGGKHDNHQDTLRRGKPVDRPNKELAPDPREDPTKQFPGLGRHERQDLGHEGQSDQHKK